MQGSARMPSVHMSCNSTGQPPLSKDNWHWPHGPGCDLVLHASQGLANEQDKS